MDLVLVFTFTHASRLDGSRLLCASRSLSTRQHARDVLMGNTIPSNMVTPSTRRENEASTVWGICVSLVPVFWPISLMGRVCVTCVAIEGVVIHLWAGRHLCIEMSCICLFLYRDVRVWDAGCTVKHVLSGVPPFHFDTLSKATAQPGDQIHGYCTSLHNPSHPYPLRRFLSEPLRPPRQPGQHKQHGTCGLTRTRRRRNQRKIQRYFYQGPDLGCAISHNGWASAGSH